MKFEELKGKYWQVQNTIDLSGLEDKIEVKELKNSSKPKFLYSFEDGNLIFKEADQDFQGLAEVLYGIFAGNCGLRSVQYHFAKTKDFKGVAAIDLDKESFMSGEELIAKNIYKSPEERNKYMNYFPVDYAVMNLVENNLEKVSEYLKKEFKDSATVERLENQLLRMFTLDYLLEHQGRTPSNWGFINKDGKVNLVVFENENILNMTKDKKYFEEMKNKIAKGEKVENDKQRGKYTFSLLPADSDTPFLEQILQVYKNGDVKKQEVIESVLSYFNFEDEITNFEFHKKLDSDLKYVSYMQVANRKVALIRGVEKIKEERKLEAGKTR